MPFIMKNLTPLPFFGVEKAKSMKFKRNSRVILGQGPTKEQWGTLKEIQQNQLAGFGMMILTPPRRHILHNFHRYFLNPD